MSAINQHYTRHTDTEIFGFSGDYFFLSNFYYEKYKKLVVINNIEFDTSEHAYQSAKSYHTEPAFLSCTTNQSKKLGRTIPCRSDWDNVKIHEMYKIVFCKFFNNENLKQLLINTNDRKLIEANYWGDSFWGVDENGNGLNHLGKLLEVVRFQLKTINKTDLFQ